MPNKKYNIRLLPHDKKIEAQSGKSLMESLMYKNIFLRADCGGKGACKKCQVKIVEENGEFELKEACTFSVSKDITIEIPETSMLSSHIISKAPVSLPVAFTDRFNNTDDSACYGIAVDLGTTTIAVYLCNTTLGKILSSLSVKNPQVLYGDDVMSRIGAVNQDGKNLGHLQRLVVRAIEWGMKDLLKTLELEESLISQMVVVGNPTMIHIFAGVDPESIGVSPYLPAFYEAKNILSKDLGFKSGNFPIQILPQVSGFIGGDILSAAIAADLENQADGTLLIDLGTNGELLLKANNGFYATSCATGPAFEGASLSCGMQAIPGAVNKVKIKDQKALPEYTLINSSKSSKPKPFGICGTGVISAIAQFCEKDIIEPSGAFKKDIIISALKNDSPGKMQYNIVSDDSSQNGSDVFISQKDIRSVQLGKAAL
ncbi:MAG: DUF4445 domain-containing protein, partial [Desulfobacteraceae bacterium]|nr:DUF4445 domain-containing protein [Desulfobacteraceae bacterium]